MILLGHAKLILVQGPLLSLLTLAHAHNKLPSTRLRARERPNRRIPVTPRMRQLCTSIGHISLRTAAQQGQQHDRQKLQH